LRDNRDGTFNVELYETLDHAYNHPECRLAHAVSLSAGHQTLTLTVDAPALSCACVSLPLVSAAAGVTLITGAEMVVYRFRTDVYDAAEEDSSSIVNYEIKRVDDHFDAEIETNDYNDSVCAKIIDYNVNSDLKQVRIGKVFTTAGGSVVIYNDIHYPLQQIRFVHPLLSSPALVSDVEEESNALVLTLNKELLFYTDFLPAESIEDIFGCEIQFAQDKKKAIDYRVFDDRRVEFYNESEIASGDVVIEYRTQPTIQSIPNSNFKQISVIAGQEISLQIASIANKILFSDLDKITIRFFHLLNDINVKAPTYVNFVVNGTYICSTANYQVVGFNDRAEIREFAVTAEQFNFNYGSDTFTAENTIISNVEVNFVSGSASAYCDEIQVVANKTETSSNCRVVVNGEEKYLSEDVVSKRSDTYELRVQDGLVDVACNDKVVYTYAVDLNNATAGIGAAARVENDKLNATFRDLTTILYMDSATSLNVLGRYVETEATLRKGVSQNTLLRKFELDFESNEPLYPDRLYSASVSVQEYCDTSTVAIIGMGKRSETLVSRGVGLETEGAPVDFDVNNSPDGRHFKLTSFPVQSTSLEVFREHNGVVRTLEESVDYMFNAEMGELVLYHPIAQRDSLRAEYVSLADTNVPEIFTNINDVVRKFGSVSVDNTLSLGAMLAFQNGAKRIMAIQALDPTVDNNWSQSYRALEKEEAYFIVPMPPSSYPGIVLAGTQHVLQQSMTSKRHERVLIIGETDDLSREDLGLSSNSLRVVFLKSDLASSVIQGETAVLSGMHLAAAYAGKASSLNMIAEPLTGKTLIGLSANPRAKYSNLEIELMIQEGITLVQAFQGKSQIKRSITTTLSSNATEEEPSIVRISDYLAMNIRKTLEDKYVGKVVMFDVLKEIETATKQFLQQQIAKTLITQFANVKVKVDAQEPRQVNVSFDCRPVYPLNTIVISINAVANL